MVKITQAYRTSRALLVDPPPDRKDKGFPLPKGHCIPERLNGTANRSSLHILHAALATAAGLQEHFLDTNPDTKARETGRKMRTGQTAELNPFLTWSHPADQGGHGYGRLGD